MYPLQPNVYKHGGHCLATALQNNRDNEETWQSEDSGQSLISSITEGISMQNSGNFIQYIFFFWCLI